MIERNSFTPEDSVLPPAIWQMPDKGQPLPWVEIEGKPSALALLERLPERGLAVVGTREPQLRSVHFVRQEIQRLRGQDLVILSGLARGIDAAAHLSALDAGLPTVAVLGGGLDLEYPWENRDLRRRILESGGLVVSEFPTQAKASPGNFLRRNRLIAAWSQATWIAEAPARSGAMSTAAWTRLAGRLRYATPSFPGDPDYAGNQKLLDADDDPALCFWGAESLSSTWTELLRLGNGRRRKVSNLACSDEERIGEKIAELTRAQGGSQVQEALDWAIAADWTPQRFFLALQKTLANGLVKDQQGILVSYGT